MSFEVEAKSYYESIKTSTNYIDNNLPIKAVLDRHIANLFFGGDTSRVIYANSTNAFRRRLETKGEGLDVEDKFMLSQLGLPFANFWESKDVELDKQAAAAQYFGVYSIEAALWFKFLGSKRHYSLNVFFDNIEDLRLANHEALFEMSLGTPAQYMCGYMWRDRSIDIPVFVKTASVTSNRNWDSSKLVESFPIYCLTLEFEISTVELLLNRGLNGIKLPLKFYTHDDNWKDSNDNIIYYTQKVVLDFAVDHYGAICGVEDDNESNETPAQVVESKYRAATAAEKETADKQFIPELENLRMNTVNNQMYDVVQGYFDESHLVELNRCRYNASKTTVDEGTGMVKAWIDILVKPSCYNLFHHIEVLVPSRDMTILEDCKLTNFQIDGLYPNSTYRVFIITHSINGEKNTVELEFTTPKWSKETIVEDVTSPGTTTQVVVTDEASSPKSSDGKPKRISPNALLGFDL